MSRQLLRGHLDDSRDYGVLRFGQVLPKVSDVPSVSCDLQFHFETKSQTGPVLKCGIRAGSLYTTSTIQFYFLKGFFKVFKAYWSMF